MAPKQTLGALGTRDGLIRYFEASNKVRLQAYLDSEGIPTIGWGATSYTDGRPVRMGDKVTAAQAEELFKFHVDRSVASLRSLPSWAKFNENQRQALESFAYNAGPNFLQSKNFKTIAGAIKNGDVQGVINALPMYTNGKTPGLVKRRQAEINLFKVPVDAPKPETPAAQPAAGTPAVDQNILQKFLNKLGINGGKQSFNTEKLGQVIGEMANNPNVKSDVGLAIFASSTNGNALNKWNSLDKASKQAWRTVGGELGIQQMMQNKAPSKPFSLPKSTGVGASQYNPVTKTDLSIRGAQPGDLNYGTSRTQVGGLPGLKEIAQAGIANYGAFKNKSSGYGATTFGMSNSTVGRINSRSYGTPMNLGGSLGINTAATAAAGTKYGGAAMSMNTSANVAASYGKQ